MPLLGFGQVKFSKSFEKELSTPYGVVDAPIKKYISVDNGNYTMSIKITNDGVTLQKFDVKSMEEVDRSFSKDFPKYDKFVDIVQISDDKLYYIFEAYNKKQKTYSVYSRPINIEDASLGKTTKLFTTKSTVSDDPGSSNASIFSTTMLRVKKKFYVKKSFDDSKVMIYYRNTPKVKSDKKNYDIIGMHVFNASMEPIWGAENKMPYTEALINNLAYGIGSNGTAYIIIKQNKLKKHMLFTFNDGEFNKRELDIDNDIMFQKFDTRETSDGTFVVAGYYARGVDVKVDWTGGVSTSINIDGIYLFMVNKDGDITVKKELEFSYDFLKMYLSPKQQSKLKKREKDGKAGIQDLKMIELIVNEDGSVVIIGEQQWVRHEMWMIGKEMVYHYANIIITKVNNEGEIVWIKKLPKNQAGLKPIGGMGVKYVRSKTSHNFLYVDNEDNARLKVNAVPKPHKDGFGGILTAYRLNDESGVVDKHLLMNAGKIGNQKLYQFSVSRIFGVSQGVFQLEVYLKGKKDGMVKMWVTNVD